MSTRWVLSRPARVQEDGAVVPVGPVPEDAGQEVTAVYTCMVSRFSASSFCIL